MATRGAMRAADRSGRSHRPPRHPGSVRAGPRGGAGHARPGPLHRRPHPPRHGRRGRPGAPGPARVGRRLVRDHRPGRLRAARSPVAPFLPRRAAAHPRSGLAAGYGGRGRAARGGQRGRAFSWPPCPALHPGTAASWATGWPAAPSGSSAWPRPPSSWSWATPSRRCSSSLSPASWPSARPGGRGGRWPARIGLGPTSCWRGCFAAWPPPPPGPVGVALVLVVAVELVRWWIRLGRRQRLAGLGATAAPAPGPGRLPGSGPSTRWATSGPPCGCSCSRAITARSPTPSSPSVPRCAVDPLHHHVGTASTCPGSNT